MAPHLPSRRHRWLLPWTLAWTLAAGIFALLWLLLRTGSKPSRFVYPCQQAAFSAASLAFGAPLVGLLLDIRRRLVSFLRTPAGLALGALGLLTFLWSTGVLSNARADLPFRLDPPPDYRAQVYCVTDCPQDPAGDRFEGLDRLIDLMGHQGLKLYRSPHYSLDSGPQGIIAAGDVVVIKINYQWGERGGTNTDLLKGLIRRIIDHPDTFTGEIVVCENAQFNSTSGFDRSSNNAQDHALSPHDVVAHFQALGVAVSHFDWTAVRYTQVEEYSAGNLADGYVLYPYDSQLQGRISYPKFRTDPGTYISLRHGIWNPGAGAYDRERLKLINVPVLKSHHATYGATACVKDYMGVVTRELGTNSHSAIRNGILGALLCEIEPADLNLLDCIWINANPYSGPSTSYSGATRKDMLAASLDPVALDLWAVSEILIPSFLENGYSPPWPEPSADPADPRSDFREYLDSSMSWLLAAGYPVTNDPDQIDVHAWDGAAENDCNENGLPDEWDIADGTSWDHNDNGVPDECEQEYRSIGTGALADPSPKAPVK